MNPSLKKLLATSVGVLTFLFAHPALASVVIAGTRIIYDAKESEAVVKLSNEGKAPALVQAWIDDGNPKAAPADMAVPFTVTPPVARIDPGKGQTLRILYTGEPLPRERESVFWLNVVEIPPKPAGDEAEVNRLQFAFRSRIKLFFRPVGLKGNADEAPAQMTWHLIKAGNRPALEARNPSVYHVSFASLHVTGDGKTARFDEGGMIGPGETKLFPLAGEVSTNALHRVHYQAINDYGGSTEGEVDLGTPSAQ
ncbi:fimbria/pilus periplasmic chaperone [Pseudogulbenkiania subflava]|uniref:Chaperone protein EcpD n=1 Tax=Pseudogulbenkiania subflava DSM 22618 TaxID=1123014 RepID=A0A1Y6C9N1_9NEIS|nr:fimbria/pilus periplasmic chaperone [Pseudogulbenkiania subflava]SMF53003.1 chaperone protein EcpD [Pseudogulbenkiania subflava DSM 22618]